MLGGGVGYSEPDEPKPETLNHQAQTQLRFLAMKTMQCPGEDPEVRRFWGSGRIRETLNPRP